MAEFKLTRLNKPLVMKDNHRGRLQALAVNPVVPWSRLSLPEFSTARQDKGVDHVPEWVSTCKCTCTLTPSSASVKPSNSPKPTRIIVVRINTVVHDIEFIKSISLHGLPSQTPFISACFTLQLTATVVETTKKKAEAAAASDVFDLYQFVVRGLSKPKDKLYKPPIAVSVDATATATSTDATGTSKLVTKTDPIAKDGSGDDDDDDDDFDPIDMMMGGFVSRQPLSGTAAVNLYDTKTPTLQAGHGLAPRIDSLAAGGDRNTVPTRHSSATGTDRKIVPTPHSAATGKKPVDTAVAAVSSVISHVPTGVAPLSLIETVRSLPIPYTLTQRKDAASLSTIRATATEGDLLCDELVSSLASARQSVNDAAVTKPNDSKAVAAVTTTATTSLVPALRVYQLDHNRQDLVAAPELCLFTFTKQDADKWNGAMVTHGLHRFANMRLIELDPSPSMQVVEWIRKTLRIYIHCKLLAAEIYLLPGDYEQMCKHALG